MHTNLPTSCLVILLHFMLLYLHKTLTKIVLNELWRKTPMNTVHISPLAAEPLTEYLTFGGCELRFTKPLSAVSEPIVLHPDIIMCKLGVCDDAAVFHGNPSALGSCYPEDVRYNACCTGKYFIHRLRYTDPELLRIASADFVPVDVPQGYAKCSIVCVDENSIISYDDGIARACLNAGMNVLHITAGHVLLPGYPVGFIGGCSGRIGNEIIFNGDLSAHPDFTAIRAFIESRGLSCRWFDTYPLTDIGSLIVEKK